MPNPFEADYRSLLEASAFAARAHRHQLRKDDKTPYVSHVFRVCLVVRHVFGIDDPKVLTAALLHDTVEDTTKDFDDLQEHFGDDVAEWVSALSKDKRLPDAEREKAYEARLAGAPWQVQICKLADVFDNLMDSVHMRAEQQAKSFKNAHRYLGALRPHLDQRAQGPWQKVSQLLSAMESSSAK